MTLVSGKTDDVISCSLHDVDLVPESPEYTALSYVWDGQDNQLEMSPEGRIFQVMRNLRPSLCRLRQDDDGLTLWVDALCTDQAMGKRWKGQSSLSHSRELLLKPE